MTVDDCGMYVMIDKHMIWMSVANQIFFISYQHSWAMLKTELAVYSYTNAQFEQLNRHAVKITSGSTVRLVTQLYHEHMSWKVNATRGRGRPRTSIIKFTQWTDMKYPQAIRMARHHDDWRITASSPRMVDGTIDFLMSILKKFREAHLISRSFAVSMTVCSPESWKLVNWKVSQYTDWDINMTANMTAALMTRSVWEHLQSEREASFDTIYILSRWLCWTHGGFVGMN